MARTKILDAYVWLLCEEGERAATIDATAARAAVSKGGLLYHFASKEALAQAVIGACTELAARDCQEMAAAPEGTSVHFVRTSAVLGTEFDRYLLAVERLSQAGNEQAAQCLKSISGQWYELILAEVRDPAVAQAIMLIGEGIYAHAGRPAWWHDSDFDDRLTQLLELVANMKKLGNLNE
ncbi:TetR/AcrR family transcriptional regulator [Glutamicibacter sp. MNS18]|uniref:TetR/AcrR family transcriptional regulator n=1 Tax=Glutamicibacter sp. MNS18 TaxID=2989817 RepID=UPI002235D411|nr:TetR/AcrR family transcriptional regulator [Glutamicibacter sp. MNS18]MCW4467090.1 TetR/AcrR family transcriptional regulator [Glutamicibacter sp. MNS18]